MCLSALLVACTPASQEAQVAAPMHPSDTAFSHPTEEITGTVNGSALRFVHSGFTQYSLERDGQVMSGHLNTERGHGGDRDATVYVLNDDQPVSAQLCFVRYTSGRVAMLDSARREIPGTNLVLVRR
jgi:hypothetical protein